MSKIKAMANRSIEKGINIEGMSTESIRATFYFYIGFVDRDYEPERICHTTTGEPDKDRRVHDFSIANEYGGW